MVQAGNDEALVRTEQFKTWARATGKDVCSLMSWALTVLDDENDPVNDGFTVRDRISRGTGAGVNGLIFKGQGLQAPTPR